MKPLPPRVALARDRIRDVERLYERTAASPPGDLASVVKDELAVDLESEYGGSPIAHPFGKASGQLSLSRQQVDADLAAGIGFVVLKTVIAEDPGGVRSMEAWATDVTRMTVERRTGAGGREGWTVTWTGRGWSGTLAEYADLLRHSTRAAAARSIPVVPSVKFHLPAADQAFNLGEYRHTLDALGDAVPAGALVLEKDFSPTLAGADRASDREVVLRWLREVPATIVAATSRQVTLGVKVMNALFDDAFQAEMVETLCHHAPDDVAYLVLFNRLFDSTRGVAFGGWDLSDRNLRVLDAVRRRGIVMPPVSATGNIVSGRVMAEYARRGCRSGQVHTLFQVPKTEYRATGGSRTARTLHRLLLDPHDGLVIWLRHLHQDLGLDTVDGRLRFHDLTAHALASHRR